MLTGEFQETEVFRQAFFKTEPLGLNKNEES